MFKPHKFISRCPLLTIQSQTPAFKQITSSKSWFNPWTVNPADQPVYLFYHRRSWHLGEQFIHMRPLFHISILQKNRQNFDGRLQLEHIRPSPTLDSSNTNARLEKDISQCFS